MWKFFNPNADTELNIAKLSDFVLSDQTGLENAGINMGYVCDKHRYNNGYHWRLYTFQGIASTLLFLFLTQLGNPSTSNKRRDNFNSFTTESLARTEESEADISLVEDILPMILSRTGSVTQILINAMLVSSPLLLSPLTVHDMIFCRQLPSSRFGLWWIY